MPHDTAPLKSALVELCLDRITAILEKHRYGFNYEMARSDGKGYEPPSGHLMPFSTRQQFLAMFDPLN